LNAHLITLGLAAILAGAASALPAPLLASSAPAEAVMQEQEGPEVLKGAGDVENAERSLRRVLHLRGGATLRVVARWNGELGCWQYRKDGAHRTLPPGAVVDVRLEREVLAELEERRREVEAGDLHARSLLASWMLEQGLLEEGLSELEAILELDPDQRAARLAATLHRPLFRLPQIPEGDDEAEQLEALLVWGGGQMRVLREMLLHDLGRAELELDLEERLTQELRSHHDGRRIFAAHALRRLYPSGGVRPLLRRSVLDRSSSVRREAALALAAVRDESVAAPLVRALDSSHSAVRANAAEALGNMGYQAAVGPLIAHLATLPASGGSGSTVPRGHIFVGRQFAYLQDFDVEVAGFQSVGDPQINVLQEGAVLDAGVVGVEQTVYVREARSIRTALGKLTGADPGSRSRDWLRWWEEREAETRD